jgi:CDP-diacylglycerol---serine O-phosphatidyltransferase
MRAKGESHERRFFQKSRVFKKDRMKKGIYVLPNLFTTASLFAGVYSIASAINGNFLHAAIAIPVSFILDGLDGRIARLTHTTSKFGVEYDSLSDLVSFGVAPAVLSYTWALSSFGRWGWLAAAMYIACGALRLARFNIQIGIIDSKVFNGLAIPAAALVVSSAVLLYHHQGGDGPFSHPAVLFGVIVLSLLMVSNIKYYSFKDLNIFAREPFMSFVLLVIFMIIILAEPQIMIFTFAVSYALSGPIWVIFKVVKEMNHRTKKIQPMVEEPPKTGS